MGDSSNQCVSSLSVKYSLDAASPRWLPVLPKTMSTEDLDNFPIKLKL